LKQHALTPGGYILPPLRGSTRTRLAATSLSLLSSQQPQFGQVSFEEGRPGRSGKNVTLPSDSTRPGASNAVATVVETVLLRSHALNRRPYSAYCQLCDLSYI